MIVPGDLCRVDLGRPFVSLWSLNGETSVPGFTVVRDGDAALVLSLGPPPRGLNDDLVCVLVPEGTAWIHPTLLVPVSLLHAAMG